MNIREKVRGALRRIAGVSLGEAMAVEASSLWAMGPAAGEGSSNSPEKRRTVALPSILQAFGYGRGGAAWGQAMPKPTPANLRRCAETRVARKPINTIKPGIGGMKWGGRAKRGGGLKQVPGGAGRVR